MEISQLLKQIELFRGLSESDLSQIASICEEKELAKGDMFAVEGEIGDHLGIVKEGIMEIEISPGKGLPPKTIVHLGRGQIVGEMSLVDQGKRSASARVMETPTKVIIIRHEDFHQLCEANPQIGYAVMRNLAADLSFKLRHRSPEFRGG